MNKLLSIIDKLLCFIIGNTLGRLMFSNKYIKGRHYKGITSEGWKWLTKGIWQQKILGHNRYIKFPVNSQSIVSSNNIEFDPNDLNNFNHFGCYYQNFKGKISIGSGTYIAPNVGIITSNHCLYDLDKHQEGKDIIIGKKCWIGMNSVILPGVELGNHTIVGAGSIVTKSFKEGNCVIAGNPAKIIKKLEEKK